MRPVPHLCRLNRPTPCGGNAPIETKEKETIRREHRETKERPETRGWRDIERQETDTPERDRREIPERATRGEDLYY